jgi:hypothetical protein
MDRDLAWYELRGTDLARSLSEAIKEVETDNKARDREYITFLRLYDARSIRGLAVRDYFKTQPGMADPLALNIVRRITDFAVNRIGKAYPAVRILTTDATWETRRQARELERLVEGCFYSSGLYPKALVALLHGCLLGTGAVKVIERDARIDYEWTFPGELYAPLSEQPYGDVRTLYQRKSIDRSRIIKLYPKLKAERHRLPQLVDVWEAWRLPSSEGAEDGRHAIIVPEVNVVVADDPWKHSRFPFAWFRYGVDPLGYWSSGLGKCLLPFQFDINLTLRTIQANLRAGANLKILLPVESSVPDGHVTNAPGAIIRYAGGAAPTYLVHPSVSPDVRQHLEFLLFQAWEETGFNQLSGSSQKPTGLNSGIALRTWQDQQTERQVLLGKQWEDFFRQLATLTIDAAQRIYQREGEFVATWAAKGQAKQSSMADAMLDDGMYEIEVYSASRLPDSPSGRLEFVQELMSSGLLTDPVQALQLLDFPDTEAAVRELTAQREAIEQRLDQIMQGGEFLPPHDRMNLQLAKTMANAAYCRAEIEGAPVEVVDRIGRFADIAEELLQAAAQPPPGAAPQQAPAVPGELPTQELPAAQMPAA